VFYSQLGCSGMSLVEVDNLGWMVGSHGHPTRNIQSGWQWWGVFFSDPPSPHRGEERNELMISGIPFGFGLLAIFQGSYQYLMDAYGPYAASAVGPLLISFSTIDGKRADG
jgi:hypothetical protein